MNINSIKRVTTLVLYALIMVACSQIANEEKRKLTTLAKQKERYLQDLRFIAKLPRSPGTKHHKKVQKMCAKRLEDLGYHVENYNYGTGVNIIGVHPGKQNSAEKVLVSAHYDTVLGCNGADDNASGVAAVLETAKLLISKQHKRSLIVACWDEEENGLIGSREFVAREKNNNSDIKISYVYEMIGYKSDDPNSQHIPPGFEVLYPQQVKQIQNNQNRGDFILLVYDEQASKMLSIITKYAQKQNLPLIHIEVKANLKNTPSLSDLRRSDHASFWDKDYPAMMITDTADFRNNNYHCLKGADNIENLDIDFAIKTINMLSKTIVENLAK